VCMDMDWVMNDAAAVGESESVFPICTTLKSQLQYSWNSIRRYTMCDHYVRMFGKHWDRFWHELLRCYDLNIEIS
jgi:hypothetical protein